MGGIFITKFLVDNNIKVKKIVTVAVFNHIQFDEDNSLYDSFYMLDEDIAKICKLCDEVICIYSDNDPYVSTEKAEIFVDKIQGKKVLINHADTLMKNMVIKSLKYL